MADRETRYLRNVFTIIRGHEDDFLAGKRSLMTYVKDQWGFLAGAAELPLGDPNGKIQSEVPLYQFWNVKNLDTVPDVMVGFLKDFPDEDLALLQSMPPQNHGQLVQVRYTGDDPTPRPPWAGEQNNRYVYEELRLGYLMPSVVLNGNPPVLAGDEYLMLMGRFVVATRDKWTLVVGAEQVSGEPGLICNLWRVPPCNSLDEALNTLPEAAQKILAQATSRGTLLTRKLLYPLITEQIADDVGIPSE